MIRVTFVFLSFSDFSESADLLGFLHKTFSSVYRYLSEKEKISSEGLFSEQKCLVFGRGQKRMARLLS